MTVKNSFYVLNSYIKSGLFLIWAIWALGRFGSGLLWRWAILTLIPNQGSYYFVVEDTKPDCLLLDITD